MLNLTPEVRAKLAEPRGPILQSKDLRAAIGDAEVVVAVGDVVSLTCFKEGIIPKLHIVDYQTKRSGFSQELYDGLHEFDMYVTAVLNVKNPAGDIHDEARETIFCALQDLPQACIRIEVHGEEDLLTIPVLQFAKNGTKVVYGVPNRGLCVITVGNELRSETLALVRGAGYH